MLQCESHKLYRRTLLDPLESLDRQTVGGLNHIAPSQSSCHLVLLRPGMIVDCWAMMPFASLFLCASTLLGLFSNESFGSASGCLSPGLCFWKMPLLLAGLALAGSRLLHLRDPGRMPFQAISHQNSVRGLGRLPLSYHLTVSSSCHLRCP